MTSELWRVGHGFLVLVSPRPPMWTSVFREEELPVLPVPWRCSSGLVMATGRLRFLTQGGPRSLVLCSCNSVSKESGSSCWTMVQKQDSAPGRSPFHLG